MRKNLNFDKIKRVVIKIGTSVLTDSDGNFSLSRLDPVMAQIQDLLKSKHQLVVVTSGAIGCGMSVLKIKRKPKELPLLQACAATGQGKLMKRYEELFSSAGHHAAQVLLTRDGFQDRVRCLNMKNTFESLLRLGVIPVVNENDTVSTEEIRFGDNDALSVSVAELIEADMLILLTDVDGLYLDGEGKKIVSEVHSISAVDALFQHVFSHRKKIITRGGMESKLEVAKRAMKNGISTVVLNGKDKQSIEKLFSGEIVGTLFLAAESKKSFKKNWMANLTDPHGNLLVDAGAFTALKNGGKSLLPTGIREVEGSFKAGDSVKISLRDGKIFARGIVNYSSDELRKIIGKKTADIVEILGYKHTDEVVHRDNLVLTG